MLLIDDAGPRTSCAMTDAISERPASTAAALSLARRIRVTSARSTATTPASSSAAAAAGITFCQLIPRYVVHRGVARYVTAVPIAATPVAAAAPATHRYQPGRSNVCTTVTAAAAITATDRVGSTRACTPPARKAGIGSAGRT